MTVYLDLVFFLNLFFDLVLLIAVKILLKRYVKFYRLILGALGGSLSTFLLFLKINSIQLFAFKIILSLFMVWVSFGYKNIRYFFKNFISLYIVSCFLGGILYFLNNCFSYRHQGLIFINKGISINIIFIILITPIIIYIYIKENKILKEEYSHYYKVKLVFNTNKELNINGYLDTGNNIVDPVSKKRVILINKNLIDNYIKIRSPIYVPIHTVNQNSLLECFKIKAVYINDRLIPNILIGRSENNFHLDNIDCILNNKLIKEIR